MIGLAVTATKLGRVAHTLLPFVISALLWEIVSNLLGASRCPGIGQTVSVMLGSFFQEPIIEAQGGGSGGFIPHIVATAKGFLSGFTLGALLGLSMALLMAQSRAMAQLVEPALEFFRALPPLLVVPFAILMCRSNDLLQAFTVTIYSAFSVCIYALNALRNLAPNYMHLARLLGAKRWRTILDVQIPGIMPELLGALRVTAALSLGICVVVEYLAAPQGIGRVMKFAISYSRVDLILVATIWVVIIALLTVDVALTLAFRFLLRWTTR